MNQLFLGQDAEGGSFTVETSSLTKHCIVFGATGSGKTVLCKNVIEQASSAGIPVLALDPKGDIGCLAIRSADFAFRPYSDLEAKLLGRTPERYGEELSSEYREKFQASGRTGEDLSRFVEGTEVRIYTPRSSSGVPVSMSPKLAPPKNFSQMMIEEPSLALDLLELKASNLLRLAGYGEESKIERSLITQILEIEWKNGREPLLERLIELVNNPPFDKLGMLPLDEAIVKRNRDELGRRLNVLLTDAGAKAWFIGEQPDFDRWFRRRQGKTPICVVDLRTIPSEEGKQVFVAYLLEQLFYWLTRQEGTQTLQYLLYFDEIHGYCPPVREPPSKKILIHLIHVSRALGLGIVMATQNPVDVDYKVISNANLRLIGNLSTRQDVERVRTGLSLGADAFQVISGLRKKQFYYQRFDQGESGIVSPGWLMSYHRGPLEPREIRKLATGTPDHVVVKALPMLVPEEVLLREVEKRRVKRGILGGPEEKTEFAKTVYLPYLEFGYRYSAEKGFFAKRTVLNEGKSAVLALREAELGFEPSLVNTLPELVDAELAPDSIVTGVESTSLVQERIDGINRLFADHDKQLHQLSMRHKAVSRGKPVDRDIDDHIERLENAKSSRWKLFADGLNLPSKTDPHSLELLNGGLFYQPYFVVKLVRTGETRFLVWDRHGRENDTIADELLKNRKLRALVESLAES